VRLEYILEVIYGKPGLTRNAFDAICDSQEMHFCFGYIAD